MLVYSSSLSHPYNTNKFYYSIKNETYFATPHRASSHIHTSHKVKCCSKNKTRAGSGGGGGSGGGSGGGEWWGGSGGGGESDRTST